MHATALPPSLRALLLVATLTPLVMPALAQNAPSDGQPSGTSAPVAEKQEERGDVTRQWLKAQGNKEQASRNRQTLSGPVMSAVHERYVDSFKAKVEPTSLHNRSAVRD